MALSSNVALRKRGRPTTTDGFPRLHIRIPHDLYKQVAASAYMRCTSMNTEVTRRLYMSYKQERT